MFRLFIKIYNNRGVLLGLIVSVLFHILAGGVLSSFKSIELVLGVLGKSGALNILGLIGGLGSV